MNRILNQNTFWVGEIDGILFMRPPRIKQKILPNGNVRLNMDCYGRKQITVNPKMINVRSVIRELEKEMLRRMTQRYIPGSITLKEFSEQWLNEFIKTKRDPSTYINYKSILDKHINLCFGHRKLDDIRRKEVSEFLCELLEKDGLSESAVKRIKSVFHNIYEFAIFSEKVTENPVTNQSYTFKTSRITMKPKYKTWDFTQMESILESARVYDPRIYAFVSIAAVTGSRMMEIAALKSGDINLKNNYITIERSLYLGREKSTKTKNIHLAYFPDGLNSLLAEHMKIYPSSSHGYIFHNEDIPWSGKYIRKHFREILIVAKVPQYHFRRLRDYCASIMHRNGANISFIQQQLGHSNPKTTMSYIRKINEENDIHHSQIDKYIYHNFNATSLFNTCQNPIQKEIIQ